MPQVTPIARAKECQHTIKAGVYCGLNWGEGGERDISVKNAMLQGGEGRNEGSNC